MSVTHRMITCFLRHRTIYEATKISRAKPLLGQEVLTPHSERCCEAFEGMVGSNFLKRFRSCLGAESVIPDSSERDRS